MFTDSLTFLTQDSVEARFAIETVRDASRLARRIQVEMVGSGLTKDDRSPVTVADFAVQTLVARRLAESFPGDTLIGEEQACTLRLEEGRATLEQVANFVRTAIPDATPHEVCELIDRGNHEEGATPPATFWTLDPIDGTKGFLRREQYAIALALVHEGDPRLGILGCPELLDSRRPEIGGVGSLVVAASGHGAWHQPLSGGNDWQRLRVSQRLQPPETKILRSVEKAHTNIDEIGQLATKLGVTVPPVAMDSQAKYAVLAAGEGDVLLRLISPSRPNYREKIWDQAAGSIVVEEAGGRITDLDGKPLDFAHGRTLAKNRGILATNGQLHDAVLAALRDRRVTTDPRWVGYIARPSWSGSVNAPREGHSAIVTKARPRYDTGLPNSSNGPRNLELKALGRCIYPNAGRSPWRHLAGVPIEGVFVSALVKELVEAGVHFGHRASRWNPKMRPYIYARKNLIHIIDVRETVRGLLRAKKYLTQISSQGSLVLFVGTKRQAADSIARESLRCGMPYVNDRWLGGTLTNFRTIRSRLTRLEELEGLRGDEAKFDAYSKKMQSALNREYRKMFRNLDGIRTMNRLPECLVIVDPKKEKNAVSEAQKLGVATVALIDTDCDPDLVDLPIPGNDDSMRSIELVIKMLADAIVAGKNRAAIESQHAARGEEVAVGV